MPWFSLSSPLSGWQWFLFALIPPAIVALYFLKLRRQPIQVPSTYLWERTLEDMNVNSLWQKLRMSLLLLLQLMIVGLLMLASLRLGWQADELIAERVIILIDNSASMSTTDGNATGDSRLEQAKEQAHDVVDRLPPKGVAMVISFADGVSDVLPFTGDRRLLHRRIHAIAPTQRWTRIGEALRAASGLANPGRSGDSMAGDTAAADALPATLFVLSDGGFRGVPDFSWGNLQPQYTAIGDQATTNVAIVAFHANQVVGRPEKMQVVAVLKNFSPQEAEVEVSLYLDDTLLDAATTTLLPDSTGGAEFTLDRPEEGSLRAVLRPDDKLPLDNVAYAAINPPQKAEILLVTNGNESLEFALTTQDRASVSSLTIMSADALETDRYKKPAADGEWRLIVYDDCAPADPPAANTIFLGKLPPSSHWSQKERKEVPRIIDVMASHPLMRFLDLGDVTLAQASPVNGPQGSLVLIDSDVGPMASIGPRDAFEDTVFGFPLVDTAEDGTRHANTDWPIRVSFPLFFRNAVDYLARVSSPSTAAPVRPGQPIELRCGEQPTVTVTDPKGNAFEIERNSDGHFTFHDTDRIGIYEYPVARDSPKGSAAWETHRFSVNLFDTVESNNRPRKAFQTAWNKVEANPGFERKRKDAWRAFAMLALGLTVLEWYVYHRRVIL